MATVHNAGDIGKAVLWIVGIVVFIWIGLTKVPDWISPEGTNGTGNRGGISGDGVGNTSRMIN